jgi:hypothetical protein
MGRFDVAVVVSNDSDLLEPIKIVREQLGKRVGILNPHKHPSVAMLPHIDFIKQIRTGVLQASQFPTSLRDRRGTFTKPRTWVLVAPNAMGLLRKVAGRTGPPAP